MRVVEDARFEEFTLQPLPTVVARQTCKTALSPCGSYLATATSRGLIKVWNVFSGQQLSKLLMQHSRDVRDRIHDDSSDFAHEFYEVSNTSEVQSLAWHPDGGTLMVLITKSLVSEVHFLETAAGVVVGRTAVDETGTAISMPPGLTHIGPPLTAAELSSNGQWIVGRTAAGDVHTWCFLRGEWTAAAEVQLQNGYDDFTGCPLAISVCHDAMESAAARVLAVLGGEGGGLQVWDINNPMDIRLPSRRWADQQHPMEGTSVSLSADGTLLAAGCSWTPLVRIYDMVVAERHVADRGTEKDCPSMREIVCTKSMAPYEALPMPDQLLELGAPNGIGSVALTPCGDFFLAAHSDGAVDVWGVASGTFRAALQGRRQQKEGRPSGARLSVSPSGTVAAAMYPDGHVLLWQLRM